MLPDKEGNTVSWACGLADNKYLIRERFGCHKTQERTSFPCYWCWTPSVTPFWFLKAKRRWGCKEGLVLLHFPFWVVLLGIGFSQAVVMTFCWELSSWSEGCLSGTRDSFLGWGMDWRNPSSLTWVCVHGDQCWWEIPSGLASGSTLLGMCGLWKLTSTAASCWAGSQQEGAVIGHLEVSFWWVLPVCTK